jgi:hypothetical protein
MDQTAHDITFQTRVFTELNARGRGTRWLDAGYLDLIDTNVDLEFWRSFRAEAKMGRLRPESLQANDSSLPSPVHVVVIHIPGIRATTLPGSFS